ncbi:MAG: cystathionine gamma-synthase [Ignavibacteriales bacterium CG07_land_8_20_14_0_80_59_12]|nr:MAG: cystathionine gamma-synthase [Ignavibacteriales bacterium CG07_land_8_20_14_0_80_59_12]
MADERMRMGFSTKAIHAGQAPDPSTGAIMTPVFLTSTYVQEELGKHKGYEYSRVSNPTRSALEANIAALEGGKYGFAFSSGMAAITALFHLLKSGDHVILSQNVYGGTYRVATQLLDRYGLEFEFVDTTDVRVIERAVRPSTKMVFVETPTNPTMEITDIRAAARIARRHRLLSVVDNTFATPYFQQPLRFGVDAVLHSATKYLNGHSDMIGGVIVTSDEVLKDRLRFVQKSVGGVLSPFDSWLCLRGTKTLAVRMERHNENGMQVAKFLSKHPAVKRVNYPGLPSHPQYALAKRQMKGFGAMISFDVGSLTAVKRLLKRVRLCSLAESLGGVETLISHPATMTHASIPKEEREARGITEGLVRISVGIEDVEDIIEDLKRALS